jgi:hypothetical protein
VIVADSERLQRLPTAHRHQLGISLETFAVASTFSEIEAARAGRASAVKARRTRPPGARALGEVFFATSVMAGAPQRRPASPPALKSSSTAR